MDLHEVAWAAELMASRREVYATYSPVFWRPRRGVTDRHAAFLGRQLQSPDSVALRTDHGFIIGQLREDEGFVDDFAIDVDGSWADDGRELLQEAWDQLAVRGAGAMRVVSAQADEPKVEMLIAVGLRLVEQWWVKPVEAIDAAGVSPGRIEGTGFSGILGPAPPVYEPGGPVLLADRIAAGADLSVIEAEAARMGSVLVVMPTEPGTKRERELRHRDWTVASQWYVGQSRSLPSQ